MGLDMYLLAEQRAKNGTAQAETVLAALSPKHMEELADHETYGHSTYVSGWTFGDGPEPAYQNLIRATGMPPASDSPHFTVSVEDDELLVRACAVYWRKANAIHMWFVEHVQDGVDDCQLSRPVNGEELAELVETCREVLETPLLAAKLLPTSHGFFFGSVDYDEWYVGDLKETVRRLTEVFETYPKPLVLRYQSSW